MPFPGHGARVGVPANGGENPLWSNGPEPFYTGSDEKTMIVSITAGMALSVGAPRVLFEAGFVRARTPSPRAIFLATDRDSCPSEQVRPDRPVTRIAIVLNWFSEPGNR